MQNDTVVIVLAHANTAFRKELLKKCLNSIEYDKILSVNYPVDADIQNDTDYVIFDKKNPVLFKEEYSMYNMHYEYWYIDPNTGEKLYESFAFEHGYAAYCLIKNGIRLAKSMGYVNVHVINYDYVIHNDELLNNELLIKENYDTVFYDYRDQEYDKSICSGFFSGKISVLEDFYELYNDRDSYYRSSTFILEQKFKSFFYTEKYNNFTKSFLELSQRELTNQEGVLQFSKSEEYNAFKFISDLAGTDKCTRHEYHKVYPLFVDKFRYDKFNMFEIGIQEGKSVNLWKQYFPNAYIYGMDISTSFETERVKIYIGDQSKTQDLESVISDMPKCKLIVDDGSHIAEHQLKTFYHLFPKMLESNGVYVIEDIECNYWHPESTIYGYETGYLNIVDHFTRLNHQISSRYNGIHNELNIGSISFHSNCIVITKKDV